MFQKILQLNKNNVVPSESVNILKMMDGPQVDGGSAIFSTTSLTRGSMDVGFEIRRREV